MTIHKKRRNHNGIGALLLLSNINQYNYNTFIQIVYYVLCDMQQLKCKIIVFVLVKNLAEALDVAGDIPAKYSRTCNNNICTSCHDIRRIGQFCAAVDFQLIWPAGESCPVKANYELFFNFRLFTLRRRAICSHFHQFPYESDESDGFYLCRHQYNPDRQSPVQPS